MKMAHKFTTTTSKFIMPNSIMEDMPKVTASEDLVKAKTVAKKAAAASTEQK